VSSARVTHVLALAEKRDRIVWGGAERHLRLLLPALARSGVGVEAIVLATSPGPTVEAGLSEWRAAGVAVRVLARRSRGGRLANLPGFVAQHLRLWWALRTRRARIVHLHLDLLFMAAAALCARCPRIVVTLHNEVLVPQRAWARRLHALWLGMLARRVGRFIAISRRVAEHFAVLSGGAAEIDVVEYGLELPVPSAGSRAPSRRDLGWPPERFLVGFVGRLVFEKNVFVLLEAAARCPDLDVVLIGDGPLRGEVEQLVAGRRLDNVRLAGAVENASDLIPLFDVFCLPSRWEGLGLVLVEAMLQRVPVIGSRGGAIPDVLGEGRYGLLFDTFDPADLVRALRRAHDRRDEMRALADRAFDYARARFSVETMAERTVRVYRRIDRGADVPAAGEPREALPDRATRRVSSLS
jgi:glycosyltransferase involved in cell wall biosynthesis